MRVVLISYADTYATMSDVVKIRKVCMDNLVTFEHFDLKRMDRLEAPGTNSEQEYLGGLFRIIKTIEVEDKSADIIIINFRYSQPLAVFLSQALPFDIHGMNFDKQAPVIHPLINWALESYHKGVRTLIALIRSRHPIMRNLSRNQLRRYLKGAAYETKN